MIRGGQKGRNGTELISSPKSSGASEGRFGGPDRTTPYRGVRLSPTSPTPSADRSTFPSRTSEPFSGKEKGDSVPQALRDPLAAAPQSGGRDGPGRGTSPVPLSPNLSPKSSATGFRPPGGFFRDEDETAFFEERAAIREFDGGLPRAAAERLALADVMAARRLVQAVTGALKAS